MEVDLFPLFLPLFPLLLRRTPEKRGEAGRDGKG